MDLHTLLVHLAKTVGLIWMMAFFLGAVWFAYRPGMKARHERAARSILQDDIAGEAGK